MHLIVLLLVIIILLLGGWWIFAIGIGLLLAAIGAVITAVIWFFKTFWITLLIAAVGFVVLGFVGLILEATGKIKPIRKFKPEPAPKRPLPPISKSWAQRKADRKTALQRPNSKD